MATNITAAFEKQYSKEVHHLFSRKGSKLKPCIRTVNGIKGSTYDFHRMGAVIANSKARDADVSPLSPVQNVVTATLVDKYAAIYLDKLDEIKTNASIRQGYAEESANALGRAVDDLIIAQLDASTPGTTIAAASTGLTFDKLTAAKRALDEGNVDTTDRVIVVSPAGIQDILAEPKMTSRDYQTMQALINGEINSALGFKWVMHTGLTIAGTDRSCYAFNKKAVGLAIGQDITTKMDWIPEKVSTLINSYISMGAAVIEEAGVVEIQITE